MFAYFLWFYLNFPPLRIHINTTKRALNSVQFFRIAAVESSKMRAAGKKAGFGDENGPIWVSG
jgi:hypothetical protein